MEDDNANVIDDEEASAGGEEEEGGEEEWDEEDDEEEIEEDESSDDDDELSLLVQDGDIIHEDVNCDECGASPIHGIRYHSTRIIDYDICEECYVNNHRYMHLAGAFVALRTPQIINEREYFDNPSTLSVDAFGWEDLIHELKQNPKVQSMDIGLHAEELDRDNDDHDDDHEDIITTNNLEWVSKKLRKSTTLKSLYIQSNYLEDYHQNEYRQHSKMITSLAKGISYNTSLVTLSLTLDFSILGAMDALCELITPKPCGTKKNTIRYLFLEHNPDRSLSANHMPDSSNFRLQFQHNNAKSNATKLFQSLAASSTNGKSSTSSTTQTTTSPLNSFVIQAYTLLEDEKCRKYALQAIKARPFLKHIKTYDVRIDNDAELLEIMQKKKQQQINWMKDWNDPTTTPTTHYNILQQLILDSSSNNHPVTSTPQDRVAAIYHFLRSNPRAILLPNDNNNKSKQQQQQKQQPNMATTTTTTAGTTAEKQQLQDNNNGDNDNSNKSGSYSNKRIRLTEG